jgi:Zn-dependent M28 family amino/carboxypeptidase
MHALEGSKYRYNNLNYTAAGIGADGVGFSSVAAGTDALAAFCSAAIRLASSWMSMTCFEVVV